jgi:CRP-like cAMP-binding protein
MSPKRKLNGRFRNRLLAALTARDLALLQPYLEPVELPTRTPMETANKRIENIFFMEHGIASVVGGGKAGRDAEVGLIGCEGMTGLPVVFGNHRSPHTVYIQVAGDGQRMTASALRNAMTQSTTLQPVLLKFAQTFMIQTTHTAIANARGSLEERLARWILMAHDRIDGDELPLTHEFLSLMLGVRRPGVTEALQALGKLGLIRAERGRIAVLDRDGIVERANGLYGVPEAEYRRLLG